MNALAHEESPPARPFNAWIREIPRACRYPLSLRAAGFILFSATLWSTAEVGPHRILRIVTMPFVWAYVAYVYAVLVNVMHRAASGDNEPPPFFVGANIVDDAVRPFMRLVGVVFISYLPFFVSALCVDDWAQNLLLLILFFGTIPYAFDLPAWLLALKLLGGIYFPMALMGVVVRHDWRALLPHVVIPSILLVLVPYLLLIGAFLGVNELHDLALRYDGWEETGPLNVYVMLWLVKIGLLYVYLVLAYLLGALHWTHRRRLGWFQRV